MNSTAQIQNFEDIAPISDVKKFNDRKLKHRVNLNQLLKEAAQADMRKSMQKKQMKYMTTQFRKQIRQINEGLDTRVPMQIFNQEQLAQRKHVIKNEILKRQPNKRYNSQSTNMQSRSSA